MRVRLISFLLLLVVTTLLAGPRVAAQQEEAPGWEPLIAGAWSPIVLEQVDGPPAQRVPEGAPASDFCSSAPLLDIGAPAGDGGATLVNTFTETPAIDPPLSCVWGTPASASGFRTAWYRFTAPTSGVAVIETVPNADYDENYDTILAVYSGTCGALTQISCNDDSGGFLSRLEVPVRWNETYYIEVADYQLAVNGIATLNVVAHMEAGGEFWNEESFLASSRSRHMVEVVGDQLYVIGGQTVLGTAPVRTGAVNRYDPATGGWETLASLPGPDGFGYSNTDSAAVNDIIYVPSGYVGDNDQYDGTHWQYDTVADAWSTTVAAPWTGAPAGYAAAVAAPNVNGYYLIGGLRGAPFSSSAEPVADVYRFRQGFGSLTDQWFSSPPALSIARYLHTGAQVLSPVDWVCVVGGLTTNNFFTSNGECYTGAGNWRLIADLNINRFGAQSVIGPDGRWYVIGGRDSFFNPVPSIEVFTPPVDPNDVSDLGTWTLLDPRYDIGDPVRTWTPGGAIGEYIYIVGGETAANQAVPLVDRLYIRPQMLSESHFFPAIFYDYDFASVSNDNFVDARPLGANLWTADRFVATNDFYDVFYFDLGVTVPVGLTLTDIPSGANYDLLLYTRDKTFVARSDNLGTTPEILNLTLPAGRYYLFVVRDLPQGMPPDAYYLLRLDLP